jgi:hypothetical protein
MFRSITYHRKTKLCKRKRINELQQWKRFLCGLSQGNNGAAVFSLRSVSWKCFLCGLFPGYIARAVQKAASLKLAVSGESSAEGLVDGQ